MRVPSRTSSVRIRWYTGSRSTVASGIRFTAGCRMRQVSAPLPVVAHCSRMVPRRVASDTKRGRPTGGCAPPRTGRRSPGEDQQLTGRDVEPVRPPRPRRPPRRDARWSRPADRTRPAARSPNASTQRSRTPSGTRERGKPSSSPRPESDPGGQLDRPRGGEAGHPGVRHRRRQLQVAEVVDPGHLGAQAGPPVVQPPQLDHAADQAEERQRVDGRRPAPPEASRGTSRPPPGRRRRARRRWHRGRAAPRSGLQLDRPRRSVPSPAASAAATNSPLSGPTKYIVPPAGSGTSRPMPRRAVPTPGSTTAEHDARAEMWDGAHQSVWLPARTSNGGMWWVRSITVVPGRPRRDHRRARRRRTRPASRSPRGRRPCRRTVPAAGRLDGLDDGMPAQGSALQVAGAFRGGRHRLHEGRTHGAGLERADARPPWCRPGTSRLARNALGLPPGLGEQARPSPHCLDHQRAAHVTGEAHLHARLDERLGHQEEVGRARAREPGDRVERAARAAAPPCPPRRAASSAQARSAAVANEPPDDRRHAGADRGRACSAWPRTTAGSPPSAASRRWQGTPATIESTRGDAGDAERAAGPLGLVGLDREHGAGRSPRRRSARAARARARRRAARRGNSSQLLAPVVQRLDHGHGAGGVGAAAEQPAQQGAAHLPAADDQQVRHARDDTDAAATRKCRRPTADPTRPR